RNGSHTQSVDVHHRVGGDVQLTYQLTFGLVERPQPYVDDIFRPDHGTATPYVEQSRVTHAQQVRHRHSVHVEAGGCLRSVEVGMRVDPQDTRATTALCNPRDGAHRNGVVAAQRDGHHA